MRRRDFNPCCTVVCRRLWLLVCIQAGKESAATSGQNTNQGWYNRFVQTGRSESETKPNGSFGGLQVWHVLLIAATIHVFICISDWSYS